MKILVLNGSPRPHGNTAKMVAAFCQGAAAAGHQTDVVNVCQKKINGCKACEYCHTKGNGVCAQKDDMQEIYVLLNEADMLVLASPIYYHGVSGQLKCAIDRFYAPAYPMLPPSLKKMALILSSGAPDVYDAAKYVYRQNFIEYYGLEDAGIFTATEGQTKAMLPKLEQFGKSLK